MLRTFLFATAIHSTFLAVAQVPVKYEPRHHNIFENEFIRVLDVHIGPKDTTLFHIHNTPSVFYTFTTTVTTSQLIGRQPSPSSASRPGPPSYDSLGTARIHRVWNNDSTWFHVMDIEIKSSKPQSSPEILQHPSLTLSFNRYLANGYRMQLKTGDRIELTANFPGYLLVSQNDAEFQYQLGTSKQQRSMKPGHYIWIEGGTSFSVNNLGTPANFMLLQLK